MWSAEGWSVMAGAILGVAWLAFAQGVAAEPAGGAVHSTLVQPGANGRLVYAPASDRGDAIPDFSNCGYMGGGVRLPEAADVPVKATLSPSPWQTSASSAEPGEGGSEGRSSPSTENASAPEPRSTASATDASSPANPSTLTPTLSLPGRGSDDTARIQAAIDQVSRLSRDPKTGFRGAVLLKRGTYRISGKLTISTSGVVLRGEGDDEKGTLLIATGTAKRTLIEVKGPGDPVEIEKTRTKVTDGYVPVGAHSFNVENSSGFHVGDNVIVHRVGNAAWIHEIAMDRITPRPGHENSTKQWQPFDLRFDRVITAIDPSTSSGQGGSRITVDAPITCAIDAIWGGGSVAKADDSQRIEQVGVEFLRGDSEYEPGVVAVHTNGKTYSSDEDHATRLVSFDNVKNAWARRLTGLHFDHGGAMVNEGAKWITVTDCTSLLPVSVITGGRRYPFAVQGGQLCLYVRCYSDEGRHAFVFGSRVGGPNVFLDCHSEHDYATSEPHHRWSVGGLYDNVNANMAFQDRQHYGSGHGWAGANYVIWNCEGKVVVQQPPTAQNWCIGFVGAKTKGAFEPRPAGYYESFGEHVAPRSLYLQQLQDRLGKQAAENAMAKVEISGSR